MPEDGTPPTNAPVLIADGYFALDGDWCFVDVNACAEEHFGREASTLLGRNVWQETGTPPTSPIYIGFHEAATHAEPVRFEAASLLKPHRWVELHVRRRPGGGLDVCFHDVTERRRAEQDLRAQASAATDARRALEQETRRLEAVLETLPVGVAITDAAGATVAANAAFENLWRGPRPEAASVEDYKAYKAWWVETGLPVGPHDWAAAVAVETGKTVVGQLMEIQRFDGTRVFVSNSAAPVLDADGAIAGSVVAIQDVTALRSADAAIRDREERYRRLFEHMAEGCFLAEIICDAEGRPHDYRYLAANPALEPLTGLKADEIVGRTIREVLPGVEERWIQAYGRVALTGQPVRIEDFAEPLGRYYSTVAYATQPGQFACLFSDITEHKKAELESQALLAVVREEKERLSALVNSIRDEVWFCDARGRFTLANPSARDEFRLTASRGGVDVESLASSLQVLRPDGTPRPLEEAPPLRALRGEVVRNQEEVIRTPAAGELRTREVSSSPVRNLSGEIIGAVSIVRDITERKRAEEALRAANASLVEADRQKDQFIAILSHELRNPLAPIRYAVPVLQSERLGEGASRAVSVIGRQVKLLTRLVDDLLDVARITTGKIELQCEEVTLRSIVTSAIEAATPAMAAVPHTLEVKVADERVWLRADAARLTQVLTNLLDNSAKFTPALGRITVRAGREGDAAVVRVSDTGMGIPGGELSSVFEMFRQVARPHSVQAGLGIGLAVAKRLVEMHGGTIEAHSEGPERGAEFVVRLPLARAAEPETPGVRQTRGPVPAHRLKVLVVDDNVDLVDMLAIVVAGAGHEVEMAYEGSAALEKAAAWHPDVILLDLGMPGISGFEVARRLKRQPATASIRLVALTGWGQPEDQRRTQEAGFDRHLTKPAEPGLVCELLELLAGEIGR